MWLTLRGNQRGQGRPRAAIRGKGKNAFVTMYTDPKDAKAQQNIRAQVAAQWGSRPAWDDDVSISVNFYFHHPKSTPKWKVEAARQGLYRPTKKPDIDNLLKLLLDAMNGVVFLDDSQVTRVSVEKAFGDPGALVLVRKRRVARSRKDLA